MHNGLDTRLPYSEEIASLKRNVRPASGEFIKDSLFLAASFACFLSVLLQAMVLLPALKQQNQSLIEQQRLLKASHDEQLMKEADLLLRLEELNKRAITPP